MPFFRPGKKENGSIIYEPARPGAIENNNSFIVPKLPGMKYIFLIGESNAASLARGADGDTVSRLAKALGHPAKAINCGMAAYDSERTYAVMKEVLRYSPDAIVVMVGNSENFTACPGIGRRLKERFYMAMNYLVWHLSSAEVRKKFLLDTQAHFFRKMARLAAKNKIPLVFCALPANLADFPPRGILPLKSPVFARGWESSAEGDYTAAKHSFAKYVSQWPKDAMGLYHLGQTLLKLGETPAALFALKAAADNDIQDSRCPGARNEMIRRTARETKTLLADIENRFYSASPTGIPGGDMFDDRTHWSHDYDMLAACTIMAPLAAAEGPFSFPGGSIWETPLCKFAASPRASPLSSEEKKHKKTILAKYLAFNMNVLSNFNKSEWLITEEIVVFMRRIYTLDRGYLLKISGSPEALAAATYTAGVKWQNIPLKNIKRFWPHYLAHLGEALRREGEPELSILYFNRALGSEPQCRDAYFYRGLAYLKAGDIQKSVSDFDRSPMPHSRVSNIADIHGFSEKLKTTATIYPPGFVQKELRGPKRDGLGKMYYVYGGTRALSGTDGLYPKDHGYILLGSTSTESTMLFSGAYSYYVIAVYDNAMVKVDALQLSDGTYYIGGFSTSNVTNWDNANGAPDGRFAIVGRSGRFLNRGSLGYLLASPGPGSTSIKIYVTGRKQVNRFLKFLHITSAVLPGQVRIFWPGPARWRSQVSHPLPDLCRYT